VDEDDVIKAHSKAYEKDEPMDSSSIGAAAAMQAFKMFTSSSTPEPKQEASGNMQTKLISMAMGEASNLFDKKGSQADNKQDAVNSAAMMIMKLMFQAKFGGTTGGSNSGGLGPMLSMVSTPLASVLA
jgi:hypothetical protein